jgi:hypothetical protein
MLHRRGRKKGQTATLCREKQAGYDLTDTRDKLAEEDIAVKIYAIKAARGKMEHCDAARKSP